MGQLFQRVRGHNHTYSLALTRYQDAGDIRVVTLVVTVSDLASGIGFRMKDLRRGLGAGCNARRPAADEACRSSCEGTRLRSAVSGAPPLGKKKTTRPVAGWSSFCHVSASAGDRAVALAFDNLAVHRKLTIEIPPELK